MTIKKVVLNQSDKLVKLSSSPETISVTCESTQNCNAYLFTSDLPTPAPPPTDYANQLEIGATQSFGRPFSVWAFIHPIRGDAEFTATLKCEFF